jgi:hypothetical protein
VTKKTAPGRAETKKPKVRKRTITDLNPKKKAGDVKGGAACHNTVRSPNY